MGNKEFSSRKWHRQKNWSGHNTGLNWVWWMEKVGIHSGYGVWDVGYQLNPSSAVFLHLPLIIGEKLGNDVSCAPLPTGVQLRVCQRESLVQDVESGSSTPYFSSGGRSCGQTWGDSGFQASSCKSASSARQAAALNGIQASLELWLSRFPGSQQQFFPTLTTPTCVWSYVFLISSFKFFLLEISGVVSAFLTNAHLLKAVKEFLQYRGEKLLGLGLEWRQWEWRRKGWN